MTTKGDNPMIVKTNKDKCTVIIPGVCTECGCEVTPDNIGFECDEFVVCKKCNDQTGQEWEDFQIDQAKEVIL
jgi:hypothetical protein